jgi:Tfp pilus assembly protein PilW
MKSGIRGISIFEVTLAALFAVVLIGSAATSVVQDTRASATLTQADVPTLSAQKAMELIAEEISMASFTAEDSDQDGLLSTTEDLNLNERLDSDWSLADGATAPSIAFNRRFDLLVGNTGSPCVAYSSAIRYRLESGRIVRETNHTASGQTIRTTVASNVSALRFTRRGSLVQVAIVIRLRDGQTRTLARSLLVRD